jgi:hypothetical protein
MPVDRVASLTEGYAELLLGDLRRATVAPGAHAAVLVLDGWRVRVEVSPASSDELVPGLNPCGRAIVSLLWDADLPLPAGRVRDALEDKELGIFGLITVRRALRLLHRAHAVLALSRARPRGYYLPHRLPLFRARPKPDDHRDDHSSGVHRE